jgi:hypothetical protein
LLQLVQLSRGLVTGVDELVKALPGDAAHGVGKSADALLQLLDLRRSGFDLHAFLVQNRFLQLCIRVVLVIATGTGGRLGGSCHGGCLLDSNNRRAAPLAAPEVLHVRGSGSGSLPPFRLAGP